MSKGPSIEGVPPSLVPSDFALMHEYYTPIVVAEAVADLVCPVFEPSMGIDRLVRALSPPRDGYPSAPSTNPAARGLCHATYRHLRR
jgi:hypothetical protein